MIFIWFPFFYKLILHHLFEFSHPFVKILVRKYVHFQYIFNWCLFEFVRIVLQINLFDWNFDKQKKRIVLCLKILAGFLSGKAICDNTRFKRANKKQTNEVNSNKKIWKLKKNHKTSLRRFWQSIGKMQIESRKKKWEWNAVRAIECANTQKIW